ncbi:MAG: FAD-dependent oxidoreductase, partial [Actinomycetota bacterium]
MIDGCLWDDPTRVAATAPDHVSGSSDVIIVGAGFTGLWTAFYLASAAPQSKIRIVEREHVGFGASGRNGGWSSALLPMSIASLVERH